MYDVEFQDMFDVGDAIDRVPAERKRVLEEVVCVTSQMLETRMKPELQVLQEEESLQDEHPVRQASHVRAD